MHKISTLFSCQFNGKSTPQSMISSLLIDKFRIQFSDVSTSLGCILVLHRAIAMVSAIFLGRGEAGASAKNLKWGGLRCRQKAPKTEKATSNNHIFNVKSKGAFQNYLATLRV